MTGSYPPEDHAGTNAACGPRVLLFPGITGEDQWFRETMSVVAPDGACETLCYPGVLGATNVLTSLPLAADLAISQIAPCGSGERFVLIGYSYGGNLAFEVAHRLIARGLSVDLLILLDPALANTTFSIHNDEPAEDSGSTYSSRRASAYTLRPIRIMLSGLAIGLPDRLKRKLNRRMLYELRIRARRDWRPTPLEVRTLHVMSGQLAGVVAQGWSALCPWIQQVPVVGNHVDILRPPGREVAARAILAALRAVAAAPARGSLAADIRPQGAPT